MNYRLWYPFFHYILVYEINESELDNLEGNGKWYTRRIISVKNNINTLEVQAYFNENAQGEIQHTGIFQAI